MKSLINLIKISSDNVMTGRPTDIIFFMEEISSLSKQVLGYKHGSETARPFRKSRGTHRRRRINQQTDQQTNIGKFRLPIDILRATLMSQVVSEE